MGTKKKSVIVRIPEPELDAMKALAVLEKRSVNNLIEYAIQRYLAGSEHLEEAAKSPEPANWEDDL